MESWSDAENSYAVWWKLHQPIERIPAKNSYLLHVEFNDIVLEIPWPEGMTAEQAIETWKRTP